MPRTVRRTPAFESMEGRVLLSKGLANPDAAMHRERAALTHFVLNGTMVGIPFGTIGPDGIAISSFSVAGKAQSMGKVVGSLLLTDTIIAPGKQPDLSNSTLTLGNPRGSVQIKMAASPSNRYVFIVTAGSGGVCLGLRVGYGRHLVQRTAARVPAYPALEQVLSRAPAPRSWNERGRPDDGAGLGAIGSGSLATGTSGLAGGPRRRRRSAAPPRGPRACGPTAIVSCLGIRAPGGCAARPMVASIRQGPDATAMVPGIGTSPSRRVGPRRGPLERGVL